MRRIKRIILRWIVGVIPALLRDAAGLAGSALIAWGAWRIYEPAGLIVAGLFLLAAALLLSRSAD